MMRIAGLAAAILWWGGAAVHAQTPAQPHEARNNARVFATDAGLVLNFVKAD